MIAAAGLLLLLEAVAGPAPGLEAGPFDYSPSQPGHGEGDPVLLWSFQLDAQRGLPSFPRPALDERYLYVGSGNRLLRLERVDGSPAGSYPARGGVAGRPQLLPDAVLFSDSSGTTWCYPLEPGLPPRWSHESGSAVVAPLLVEGQRVHAISVDDTVQALDLSGALLWSYQESSEPAPGELRLYGSAATASWRGSLLAAFHDGRLVSLDAEGVPLWSLQVGEGKYPDVVAELVVSGELVYVGAFSGPFLAVDLGSHDEAWRQDFGIASPPLLDGHTLYAGSVDGVLRALDARSGALLWEWDSECGDVLLQPQLLPSGRLLVASAGGELWLLDPASGEELRELDLGYVPSGFSSPPVVDGGQLFAVTDAGLLLAFLLPADELAPPVEPEPLAWE